MTSPSSGRGRVGSYRALTALLVVVALALVGSWLTSYGDPATDTGPGPDPASTVLVARVVDGDTIELGNGEIVRLAGIDTPEAGECGYEAAAEDLATLVLGRRVRLGPSDEDRDGYGRLLRYVDVGGVDAGLRLIDDGRAIAAYDSRDGYGFHPRQPVYVAHDRASANRCRMQTGR